ncbi:hypothetical protein PUR34_16580 [Streptomyces sp. JV185]|uniref:hypothetical protein n=1 Tax=Streptomyces sp. JV185 TaxID=858638 RepID=UPI002E775B81|nr:hypothetical protein [Streptomyces sp. JV185]MEE1769718.1 hypothetical protein [Streptomyces sp. JV185]
MESLGYVDAALVWGTPLAALLVMVLVSIAVVRWRRKTIADLERAELDAAGQLGVGRSAGASEM